jgi:hypothetical protein
VVHAFGLLAEIGLHQLQLQADAACLAAR